MLASNSGAPPSMPLVASHLTTVREVVSHPRGSKTDVAQQAAVNSSVLLAKNIALSGKLATPAQEAGVKKLPQQQFFELRSHRTNNMTTSKSTNQVIVSAPRHKSFGG